MSVSARLFAVVCDTPYYRGLQALLNSIYAYHGDNIPVHVYFRDLDHAQLSWLAMHPLRPKIWPTTDLPLPVLGMWEAKQQVFAHCLSHARCVCLLDADLVLTSGLDDVFTLAEQGSIVSSSDGGSVVYDDAYSIYNRELPGARNTYINTGALCLDVVRHWDLAGLWAFASTFAAYSPGGGAPLGLPGHGDQGVFNALATMLRKGRHYHILPEGTWCDSTKGCTLRIRTGDKSNRLAVWNETDGAPQRLVHSSGPKWWTQQGERYLRQFGDKLSCFHHFLKAEFSRPTQPAKTGPLDDGSPEGK